MRGRILRLREKRDAKTKKALSTICHTPQRVDRTSSHKPASTLGRARQTHVAASGFRGFRAPAPLLHFRLWVSAEQVAVFVSFRDHGSGCVGCCTSRPPPFTPFQFACLGRVSGITLQGRSLRDTLVGQHSSLLVYGRRFSSKVCRGLAARI